VLLVCFGQAGGLKGEGVTSRGFLFLVKAGGRRVGVGFSGDGFGGKVPKMAETRECICVGFLSGFREDCEPSFLLVLGPKTKS
jgi:hypothetical protein